MVHVTLCRHLPLAFQVAFVAAHNDGKVVLVLDPQYLLLKHPHLFKRLSGCDAVNKQEPLTGAHVLFPHRRVFFLTGGIEDIEESDFFVNDTLLAVGVCTEVSEGISVGCCNQDGPSIVGSYSSTK